MKITKTRLKQIIQEELNEANLGGLVSKIEKELHGSFKGGQFPYDEAEFMMRGRNADDAIQLVRSVAGGVRNNDGDPEFIKWLDRVVSEMEHLRAYPKNLYGDDDNFRGSNRSSGWPRRSPDRWRNPNKRRRY